MNKKLIIPLIILILLFIAGGVFWWQQGEKEGKGVKEKSGLFEKIKVSTSQGKIAFESTGNIHIINPDGTNEIRLIEGKSPIMWLPDGKKIAHKTEDAIYIINTDGTEKNKVVSFREEGAKSWPYLRIEGWFSDGKKLLFSTGYNEIFIVNIDGSNLVKLADGANPTLSPDGRKIAYEYYDQNRTSTFIYIMKSDGTEKIELVEDSGLVSWSPNGDKITYYDSGLYIINTDGTNKIMLGVGYPMVWSPDGKKIIYEKDSSLYSTNLDGTSKTKIADGIQWSEGLTKQSLSPEGEKIVFAMDGNIYTINLDGSGLTRLTESGDCKNPVWSPR